MSVGMKRWWAGWLADESGQDLIEYALLATFVALASIAAIDVIRGSMTAGYTSWDTASQDAWEVSDPISTP